MADFEQTDDGDLAITNNAFALVTGPEEIRQRVTQRIRTFLGEWFLDYTVGVPYFQDIFVKAPDEDKVSAVLKNEILGTLGVLELLTFTLDLDDDRTLSVEFSVKVYNGDVLKFVEELTI